MLKNDNKITALISAIGIAFGNPRLHKITQLTKLYKFSFQILYRSFY